MKVAGADKKYLSECNGDLCDLETLMEDNFKFEDDLSGDQSPIPPN